MHDFASIKAEVGSRLRAERERLGYKQADFGEIGGVNRNTQSAYESGSRSPDSIYLVAVERIGVDGAFVLTGRRSTATLSEAESALLDRTSRIRRTDFDAVLKIVTTLSTQAEQLPDEYVLTQVFEGLLATIDPSEPRTEQARLLARRLPIGLAQARGLRPDPRHEDPPLASVVEARATRHREPQR